ncbi:protein EMBRYONIC FLOWER 1 [Andrographis paniculata]|uniref:protein EMBRYONIC FLOWER 1 n=1 Tax=Andrographis paniculata TaxID=175694 RepID=UPI0021E8F89B|nr:protein EMBRYONIC FLOWER 1 [Andrographis paniculata]
MDKSIVAVEDNHRVSDAIALPPPRPSGSLIQINSIAIDISCANEAIQESPSGGHFSIRGFVAGVREKDWKMCLPFDSAADDVLMENLPPLSIPKSRWWHCTHCVPDIHADEKSALETPLAIEYDAETSSRPNVGEERVGLFSHNVVAAQMAGKEFESRDSGHKEEDSDPTNKVMSCHVQSIEGHKTTTSNREKIDIVEDNEGGNERAYITEANSPKAKQKHKKSADTSNTVHNEVDNASSESEDAFSVSVVHRRKRKLRSLADIMYEDRNSGGEHSRMRSTSSSGTQVKSTEAETDLHHQNLLEEVPKSSKTPQRKRKSAVEEERGPSEPTASSKRLKGNAPDAEKSRRQVGVSNSESEGNNTASAPLEIRHNAKTQPTKAKKNRMLDAGKKSRPSYIDNRTSPNLEKPFVAPPEMSIGNTTGNVHSAVSRGEKETYFSGFQSEKQVDRIPHLLKGKRPVAEPEHCSSMAPLGKNAFSDHSAAQREVALELSLNSCIGAERNTNSHMSFRKQHSNIPDLNESFTEKTSTAHGKQLPAVPEKGSLIPNRTMEMLASCSEEGKVIPGASQPQGVQSVNTSVESGGVSDDIPMEIVELLAKNQRERALANSRQHIPYKGIHGSMRGPPPPPVYLDGHPSTFHFPARNSVNFTSNEMNRGLLNFPHPKKCRMDTGNLDGSRFSLFGPFNPNRQRKAQFSTPSNVMSSGLKLGEGSDLLWPPRSKNVPFNVGIAPNCSTQANTFGGPPPFPDSYYKGKSINDSKGKGKIMGDGMEGRKSLDSYSNDTIPAMQLLSLMDRGIASAGTSFKSEKNSFLNKPFTPCSHHPPPLNSNDTPTGIPFLNTATYSQGSHCKNFPASLYNGVGFPGGVESLKKPHPRGQVSSQEPVQSKSPYFGGAIPPSRETLSMGVCALNRNPADFTVPEAGNEYMISAKDLKARKRSNALKERVQHANVDGQKRQRARKIPAAGKSYRENSLV